MAPGSDFGLEFAELKNSPTWRHGARSSSLVEVVVVVVVVVVHKLPLLLLLAEPKNSATWRPLGQMSSGGCKGLKWSRVLGCY